jgi:hypothetical protein
MANLLAADVPIKQDDPNACNAWPSTDHEISLIRHVHPDP